MVAEPTIERRRRQRPRNAWLVVVLAILVVGGVLAWGSLVGTSNDTDVAQYGWCSNDPRPDVYFDTIPTGTVTVRVKRRWFHPTAYKAIDKSGAETALTRIHYADGVPNCAG